jgi:hypothetical protein
MIVERRAIRLDFDAAADAVDVVTAEADAGKTSGVSGPRTVTLLVDDQGFLVGVDARDAHGRGVVIMLGPDAAVASTQEVQVQAGVDEAGAVTRLRIDRARKSVRADLPNPYLR